jgi:hypothetical protein
MNFELLPTLGPWLVALFVVAAVAVVLAAGLVIDFAVRNHRIRIARHESIRSYYGHIALSH